MAIVLRKDLTLWTYVVASNEKRNLIPVLTLTYM